MQGLQNIREMNDQELDLVYGGRVHSIHAAYTDAQVSVHADATGGYFHLDAVLAETKSVSITAAGESVSSSVGFALALAL